ncbi:MAG: polyphenol oxidase family protein, partial [Gemmatimonadota bacterium]
MTRGAAPPALGAESLEGRTIRERPDRAEPATALRHAGWEAVHAGLACGITTAFAGDFGISGTTVDALLDAYLGLARREGFPRVVVGRQVHGVVVRALAAGAPTGDDEPALLVVSRADGLLALEPGLLLAVTAADCVPVHLLDPVARRAALLHAGWRGTAGGILERAVRAIRDAGSRLDDLHLHLGPAICGRCY